MHGCIQALDISPFFNTNLGMYITQAFFHSLAAAAVADSSIVAWNVTSPLFKQKLRLIAVFFPVFSFPAYQFLNPERGMISFRLKALFDAGGWLNLQLWGTAPLAAFLVLVFAATALVFVLQELAPILRDTVRSGKPGAEWETASNNPPLPGTLEKLPFKTPELVIVEDEELVLFSSTGRKPAVFLSTGLVEALDAEQLQAAVAHEAAHIQRSRRPVLVVAFLFRVLMFFNPVVLLEFRRIVQEEEKICDDAAVALTHRPGALAETLRKFRRSSGRLDLPVDGKLSSIGTTLEQYSHDMLLESRIMRLEQGARDNAGGGWLQFAATLGVVASLCYFIV
jgi:Zn-dependent protease with chaperone function